MRFITEMELRELYKTKPFELYAVDTGVKITPGAKQFLADRRVKLVTGAAEDKNAGEMGPGKKSGNSSWALTNLRRKMDGVDSLFLLAAAELMHGGKKGLAGEIMELSRCFRNVKHAEREGKAPNEISFWGWAESEIKARSENLEKYVDLREFHMELNNGRELALFNHLKAFLREVEPILMEAYWDEEQQNCQRDDLAEKINRIIDILSMMIWKCLEGQEWKE